MFIFMASLVILFAEAWILNRFGRERRPLRKAFRLEFPKAAPGSFDAGQLSPPKPFLACLGLLTLAAVASISSNHRIQHFVMQQEVLAARKQQVEAKPPPAEFE